MIAVAEKTCPIPYHLREYDRKTEHAFVAGTWVRSFLSTSWARSVPQEDYFHGQSAVIEAAARRGTVLVAEHDEQTGLLLGYVVAERRFNAPVLHWCYVKKAYWGVGIANALVGAALARIKRPGDKRVYFTHAKDPGSSVARRRGYVFNPYLAHMRDRME